MSFLSWSEAAQIEIVSGAFCMLRRKALNGVGLLDEDYFMYGEDIDLSYRLLRWLGKLVCASKDITLQGRKHTEVEFPLCACLL